MDGFDFVRWRSWVQAKGDAFKAQVPEVEFGSSDEHLPGFWLNLQSASALGGFRCWSNGLADYDVHDVRKQKPSLATLQMQNEVSDANFESTFDAFLAAFDRVNETEIVRGPDFSVTDKRIHFQSGEIEIGTVRAPRLEETNVRASARITVMAVGGVLLASGLVLKVTAVWIVGGLICAFAPLANVRRRGIALSVESNGQRRVIYETTNPNDAKLAQAAIEEALRRSAA